MKHIAVVTGSSAGLGIEIVVQLAAEGYRVYATMRNPDKAQALLDRLPEDADVSVLPMDVQDDQSVSQCIQSIVDREGRLDVLINNAGAGYLRNTEQADISDAQWVMDVNYLSVVRCTKAVLPQMRAQQSGHVINISSVGGLVGQPFNEFYCAAKFAVEGYTESLSSYVQPHFGIAFTLVEPGGIRTEFADRILADVEQTGGLLDDAYKPLLMDYIGTGRRRGDTVYQSAGAVAERVVSCLAMAEPPIRMRTSEWAENLCRFKTEADPDGRRQQSDVVQQMLGHDVP